MSGNGFVESELALAMLVFLGGLGGLLGILAAGTTSFEAAAAPFPFSIECLALRWRDGRRARTVAARIYYPVTGRGPFPVILFSHGLGGSRDQAAYLGRYWAAHGYVCVHVQHEGSDSSAWELHGPRPSLFRASRNPAQLVQQTQDLKFVLDQVEDLNRRHCCLAGLLDLAHIGVAGRDFGGLAALAAAGQIATRTPAHPLRADPRITAVVALDEALVADDLLQTPLPGRSDVPVLAMACGPAAPKGLSQNHHSHVARPGKTELPAGSGTDSKSRASAGSDDPPLNTHSGTATASLARLASSSRPTIPGPARLGPAWSMNHGGPAQARHFSLPVGRRAPAAWHGDADRWPSSRQYQIVFHASAAATFCGSPLRHVSHDTSLQALLQYSSLVFWNAYLKEDPRAQAWLDTGQIAAFLRGYGYLRRTLAGESNQVGSQDDRTHFQIPEMWCC